MNIDQLIIELNAKGESHQDLSNSLWSKHSKDYANKIKIFHFFDTYEPENNKKITSAECDVLKHYHDNEEKFYQKFINQFLVVLPEILNVYKVEAPDVITHEFIKENIELIAIKLEEEQGEYFLEFDFSPSWDNEHGLVALVHGDNILGFAEGGYCWFYNTEGGDGYWSVTIE